MNKRYQVFISSTYIDLKQERQTVAETIILPRPVKRLSLDRKQF